MCASAIKSPKRLLKEIPLWLMFVAAVVVVAIAMWLWCLLEVIYQMSQKGVKRLLKARSLPKNRVG
jgi:hypothetical protein